MGEASFSLCTTNRKSKPRREKKGRERRGCLPQRQGPKTEIPMEHAYRERCSKRRSAKRQSTSSEQVSYRAGEGGPRVRPHQLCTMQHKNERTQQDAPTRKRKKNATTAAQATLGNAKHRIHLDFPGDKLLGLLGCSQDSRRFGPRAARVPSPSLWVSLSPHQSHLLARVGAKQRRVATSVSGGQNRRAGKKEAGVDAETWRETERMWWQSPRYHKSGCHRGLWWEGGKARRECARALYLDGPSCSKQSSSFQGSQVAARQPN